MIKKSKRIYLFIDTSQSDFVFFVFDSNFSLLYQKIKQIKFKVEELVDTFKKISIDLKNIKNIYLNIGPGSFVGSRVAFVFIRTLAQLNSNIKIFTTNTFFLLNINSNNKILCAVKSKSELFCLPQSELDNLEKIKIISNLEANVSKIDYHYLALNFSKFTNLFKHEKNLAKIEINYLANPQIGKIK